MQHPSSWTHYSQSTPRQCHVITVRREGIFSPLSNMNSGSGKKKKKRWNHLPGAQTITEIILSLSSGREVFWSSAALLDLDQCQEFCELYIKLPRFKRNVDSKCLHRHPRADSVPLQTPSRQAKRTVPTAPRPVTLIGKKKKTLTQHSPEVNKFLR